MQNARWAPLLASFPSQANIVDLRSGVTLTRSDLLTRVEGEAEAMASLGLPRRRPVVIGHRSALDTLATLFAAWAAGHPAIIVNPELSAEEQKNVVAHTDAAHWFGPAGQRLTEGRPPQGDAASDPAAALGHDEAALILMTSGTSGVPKGIVHTIGSLEARMALNVAHIGEDVLSRSLCVLPVFFGHGLIGNCLTPLAAGGTLYLWNGPDMDETRMLGEIIDRHEITFMSSVPSFWKLAVRIATPPAKPLKRLHVGSAPLSIAQWTSIGEWNGTSEVFNVFGMSETANWIGGASLTDANGRDGYVGRIWGGEYAVLVEGGQTLPSGRGEVLVLSPSMMIEYLGEPERTSQAFHHGWLRTGDIGELGDDGALTLVGRIKSEINRAGIKVQAEEIDMLLERHPAVAQACAFAIPDPASGEAVAAAIVLKAGATADQESIKTWCRQRVRAEAVPAKLFFLSEIPTNDRGKIVRGDVRVAAKSAGAIQ